MPGKQSVACGMIPSRCHRGNNEKESEMEKTPNIADIIGNAFNQERPIQESAADLGAIILEMKREEQYYGKHTRRMVELTMLAEIQERVIHRILDRAIEKSDKPKRPHLKVVK